jgi:cytochrome b6-f complex iron-sulfur subunit
MPDEEKTEEPAAAAPKEERKPAEKAVAKAGGGMVAAGAGSHAVVIAPAPQAGPALPPVSRRKVLLISFWTGMGVMLLGIVTTIVNMVYPRGVARLAGVHPTGWTVDTLLPGDKKEVVIQVPDPMSPLLSLQAKIFLVRLSKEQADRNPGSKEGMIYALWRKCPHLGCSVPYTSTFSFEDPRSNESYSGWFRCPCHGSTYSDSGVKVFGPAPRSLDLFPVVLEDDGSISVDVGKVITGGPPSSPDQSAKGVLPA